MLIPLLISLINLLMFGPAALLGLLGHAPNLGADFVRSSVMRPLLAAGDDTGATQAIAVDLFVIFGSAAIAAILLKRLRIAIIPGYFLAGMLVGPGGMGLVSEGETLEMISYFAVILLLFGIGMHLDLDLLKREMGPMLIAGLGSCAVTAGIGFGIAVAFGVSAPAALAVGMAFSLSSTAVVMRIIAQRRDLRRPHGRLALAILIIQDLAVIVMLALLPLLASWGASSAAESGEATPTPPIAAAEAAPADAAAPDRAASAGAGDVEQAGGETAALDGGAEADMDTLRDGRAPADEEIEAIGEVAGGPLVAPEDTVPEAARRMAIKLAGAAVILAIGLIVLPRVVEEAAGGGSNEVLTVVGLAVAIGAAAATKWLGFSAELGAFVGGLLLSTSLFRHQLAGSLSTLRDIFLAVFFVSIGMRLDLAMLIEYWWVLLVGGLVVCVIKTLVIGAFAWGVGAGVGTAAIVGLSLAQAGEFTIVFVQAAERRGVVDSDLAAFSIAVVVITLFLTPGLIGLAYRIGPRLDRHFSVRAPWVKRLKPSPDAPIASIVPTDAETDPDVPAPQPPRRRASSPVSGDGTPGAAADEDVDAHGGNGASGGTPEDDDSADATPAGDDGRPPRHAIVAGYGNIGRAVVDELERLGIHCVVIELNAFTVRSERRRGRTMLYGDVSDPEVLESAGVEHARGLFITIPDDDAAVRACRVARELHPPLFIATRTHFPGPGERAREAGADHVSVDEEVSAADMRRAIRECWMPPGTKTPTRRDGRRGPR